MRGLPLQRRVEMANGGRLLVVPPSGGDSGWTYLVQGWMDSVPRRVPGAGDDPIGVDPIRPRIAYGRRGTNSAVILDLVSGVADTFTVGPDPGVVDDATTPTVEFSPRGDLLLMQPSMLSIYVWDLATKRVRDSLSGLATVALLRASDDGSVVAAIDGLQVQFWRRGAREPSSRFRWKLGAPPRTFALSPNGAMFAYDQDGRLTLGDVGRGDIIGEIETGLGHAAGVTFADGGRTLVAVNQDGRLVRIPAHPDAWIQRACAIVRSPEAFSRFAVYGPGGSIGPPQRCQPAAVER